MTTLTTPKRQSAEFPTALSAACFAISQREHGAQDVTTEERDGVHVVRWTETTTD